MDGRVIASDIDGPVTLPEVASPHRLILAATIGNVLEWYDFIAYGFLSVILAKLFFPTGNELTSLLLTLATFGVGIIMRPVGAVILGIYADRAGRKAALSVTILSMAFGTALIAVAPTYEVAGVWGTLIVVVARLIQGFSAGGELGGATSLLVEYAPPGRRGFYASWQQASQAGAFLLGSLVNFAVTSSLTPLQLEDWGWRVPFLLGVLIGPVGLYLRAKIGETPAFLAVDDRQHHSPFREILRDHHRSLIMCMGIAVLYGVSMYVLLLYMPTYAVKVLSLSYPDALLASGISGTVLFVTCPIMGMISDRLGRKPLLVAAAIVFAVATYPAFRVLVAFPNLTVLALIQSSFAMLIAMYTGPAISVFAEAFPTRVRSTGVATTYNVTITLVGGFAPFIVTWLIASTGNRLAPAFYAVAAATVSLTALSFFKDQFRRPLR